MRARSAALHRGRPAPGQARRRFPAPFSSWFNRGFLVLRRINWESPANVLEKIIAYEAVHAIDSWDDLRRRLQPPDRRCFAFFHPAMPDEPLIFVEVALTQGIPGSIQTCSPRRAALAPMQADTAVFYSISNCQAGLAGISFGNSLIKQVVEELCRELPQVTTFVTLSPIPGLMAWVRERGLERARRTPTSCAGWPRAICCRRRSPRAAPRSGRAVPPQATGPGCTRSTPAPTFAQGDGAVRRRDGELPLRSGAHHQEPRGLRDQREVAASPALRALRACR